MAAAAKPSFDLKLDRGREHLKAFEAEANPWLEGEPYAVIDEADPETVELPPGLAFPAGVQRRRFRVTHVDPIPPHLSLVIGDCVHNLRSALDHLALALARTYTPKMTDRQIAGSEFPIFGGNAMTPKEETKKIGCMAPGAQLAIKALQPYHRGNQYHTAPLWQIHDLDRIDKHRTLAVCAAGSGSAELPGWIGVTILSSEESNIVDIAWAHVIGGELKRDAVVMRYAALPVDPAKEVKMKPKPSAHIAFAEGGILPLQPVVPTLESLCDFVRDTVIAQLAKFL